ncbi:hypothetical protein VTG60DRAFT_5520 [Thermothelomyces hinnuleus]
MWFVDLDGEGPRAELPARPVGRHLLVRGKLGRSVPVWAGFGIGKPSKTHLHLAHYVACYSTYGGRDCSLATYSYRTDRSPSGATFPPNLLARPPNQIQGTRVDSLFFFSFPFFFFPLFSSHPTYPYLQGVRSGFRYIQYITPPPPPDAPYLPWRVLGQSLVSFAFVSNTAY